ncbi:MAG: hypothetical protein U0805_21500, partial [Pirellulales bacterium]
PTASKAATIALPTCTVVSCTMFLLKRFEQLHGLFAGAWGRAQRASSDLPLTLKHRRTTSNSIPSTPRTLARFSPFLQSAATKTGITPGQFQRLLRAANDVEFSESTEFGSRTIRPQEIVSSRPGI